MPPQLPDPCEQRRRPLYDQNVISPHAVTAMTMLQLSEEDAVRLIADWTKDCAWIVPAPPTPVSASPFTHPRLLVGTKDDLGNMSKAKRYALSVRRAMEGLDALAVCAGYDPEENPSFWRREFGRLAGDAGLPPPLRLTSGLLSSYDVCCRIREHASSSSLAYGIATCLAMEQTSPAMAVRHEVLVELGVYLLVSPPLLDVVFGVYPAEAFNWQSFTETLRDLGRVRELVPGAKVLKVVLGRESRAAIDPDLLMSADTEVTTLASVDVTNTHVEEDPEQWYGVGGIRRFMSSLARADTLESMSWTFGSMQLATPPVLGSALPSMRALLSLKLSHSNRQTENTALYEWLAFAIKSRELRGLDLSLITSFDAMQAGSFRRARFDEPTFSCLIPEVVRDTIKLTHFQLGTTAMAGARAKLTQDLLVDNREQALYMDVDGTAQRLDVLASSDRKCIVVMPGYGLMWIQKEALRSWSYPPDQIPRSLPIPLRSLVITDSLPRIATTVYEAVDAHSFALSISHDCPLFTHYIKAIPECCVRLRSLSIPGCMITSLGALLKGAAKRASITQSVAIGSLARPVKILKPSPFFDSITKSANNPIRHVLQELSVESASLSLHAIQILARSLATNRRLRFLQLRTSANAGALATLEDQPASAVGPTERSRVWIYAFLLSIRRSRRWLPLPDVCKRLVVEFAVVHAKRQVVLSE